MTDETSKPTGVEAIKALIKNVVTDQRALKGEVNALTVDVEDQNQAMAEGTLSLSQLANTIFVMLSMRLDDLAPLRKRTDNPELMAEADEQATMCLQLQSIVAPELFATQYNADPETGEAV